MKKGKLHQRADHLSRISNGESPIGVDEELLDATLFKIEWVPKWSEDVVEFLTTATTPNKNHDDRANFVRDCGRFTLIAGHLYYQETDFVLKRVVCPDNYDKILNDSHTLQCGQHLGGEQMVCLICFHGYWCWPTMQEDARHYAQRCVQCQVHQPKLYATLHHTMDIPAYGKHIYDFIRFGNVMNIDFLNYLKGIFYLELAT